MLLIIVYLKIHSSFHLWKKIPIFFSVTQCITKHNRLTDLLKWWDLIWRGSGHWEVCEGLQESGLVKGDRFSWPAHTWPLYSFLPGMQMWCLAKGQALCDHEEKTTWRETKKLKGILVLCVSHEQLIFLLWNICLWGSQLMSQMNP